ncbi:unnamed protein product [Durusdinium trenchii]|uniref:Uncharacterized protein n=1 Tax=Durusdinium trenchii TaxID=1381693 RepID=A0ABP0HBB7_9DINO
MQGSADGEDAPVATLQKQRPEAKQKENRRPEVPLAARKPPPAVDDNMSLAALQTLDTKKQSKGAEANGSSPGGKGAAKAKAKAKGAETNGRSPGGKSAAKAKAKAKSIEDKRSSDSSDSSSSSDSGSSKSEAKEKLPVSKRQRIARLKREKPEGEIEEEPDEEDRINNVVKKRDRTAKQQAVADLLCRWWYALPDWPPADEDFYKPKLEAKRLRQVTIQEWEWVPEEDDRGYRKVYQLSQFRGVFRNSHGDMIDLRPQETCPCFANFMKKDLPELYDLLFKAYEGQLKDLENSKYDEQKLKKEIMATMNRIKNKGYEAKKIAGPKRSRTA